LPGAIEQVEQIWSHAITSVSRSERDITSRLSAPPPRTPSETPRHNPGRQHRPTHNTPKIRGYLPTTNDLHPNHFYIRNLAGEVNELLGKNAIDLVVGDALQLGGDTVEVKFSVREKDKADTVIEFVAHYHADATGASTAARHASQWHLKKWTNNWAHKDLEPSATKYPNLFKLLPKRKDALRDARPYKSGELLYSPK